MLWARTTSKSSTLDKIWTLYNKWSKMDEVKRQSWIKMGITSISMYNAQEIEKMQEIASNAKTNVKGKIQYIYIYIGSVRYLGTSIYVAVISQGNYFHFFFFSDH